MSTSTDKVNVDKSILALNRALFDINDVQYCMTNNILSTCELANLC